MRRVAFAVLSTIAGLVGLLSFKTEATDSVAGSSAITSTTHSSPSGTTTSQAASSSGTSSKSSTAAASNTSSNKTSSAPTSSTKTITGSVVETQYGPVQVKITVTGGKITSATAIQYPNGDPRSAQINAYAVPILQKETVGKSSASSVDMVSGATYTSQGYLQSLQSALDQAGL